MSVAIRQIGDPILHQTPKPVDFSKLQQLQQYLDIMWHQLHITGGVGIACNQCAEIQEPWQMAIIGVADEQGLDRAQQRYPHEMIPPPFVIYNPHIESVSGEPYYPIHGEGCLSVAGPIRGREKRYPAVTLRYSNREGQEFSHQFSGFIAHIIQHECDHLRGKTFLDGILSELNESQLSRVKSLCQQALLFHEIQAGVLAMAPMELVFERDQQGKVIIQEDILQQALQASYLAVIEGILKRIA